MIEWADSGAEFRTDGHFSFPYNRRRAVRVTQVDSLPFFFTALFEGMFLTNRDLWEARTLQRWRGGQTDME